MSLFYYNCIREAEEKGLISKSYVNPLHIGFAANYEVEPFLSIKKKISNGECVLGSFGYPRDIEMSIINALVSGKKISKVSSLRLLELIETKRSSPSYNNMQEIEVSKRNLPAEHGVSIKQKSIEIRQRGQCRACGSLDTKRASQILNEGTSSSLGFSLSSSGSMAVGVGFSKTLQAKQAQELSIKQMKESRTGYNKLTRERVCIATIFSFAIFTPIALKIDSLGFEHWALDMGNIFVFLFYYLLIWLALYFLLPLVFARYGNKDLYEKSQVHSYSADYWKCLRCGNSWDENR